MNKILAIKNFVKAETGVTRKQMCEKSRAKNTVFARHLAMYLCRKYTTHSFPEIGRAFNRDHSSIVHAVRKVESNLKNDVTRYKEIVTKFRNAVVEDANRLIKKIKVL